MNVNSIVEQSLSLLENKIKLQKVNLQTQLDETLPLVPCDFSQIQQVLMNLIINGTEAMSNGGELNIKTYHKPDNEFVEIEVADTGAGIPDEHLSKIFDPFFSTKEAGKGVGLGLSIVYGIVNEHKGSIDVKSAEGKGTTFTIKLPTVVEEEEA